jgi:hypothetical protein
MASQKKKILSIGILMSTPEYVKSLTKAAKKAQTKEQAMKVVARAKKMAKSPSPTRRRYGLMIIAAIVGTGAIAASIYKAKGHEFSALPGYVTATFKEFGSKLQNIWSETTWDNLKSFFSSMTNKLIMTPYKYVRNKIGGMFGRKPSGNGNKGGSSLA